MDFYCHRWNTRMALAGGAFPASLTGRAGGHYGYDRLPSHTASAASEMHKAIMACSAAVSTPILTVKAPMLANTAAMPVAARNGMNIGSFRVGWGKAG